MAKDGIHPIDRFVGKQLRKARVSRNLSQSEIGAASGITFQQVQKYEKGTNRVSASRLFEFAELLGVEVSYFFEGAGDEQGLTAPAKDFSSSFDIAKADVKILRALGDIKDPKLKKKLLDLITSL